MSQPIPLRPLPADLRGLARQPGELHKRKRVVRSEIIDIARLSADERQRLSDLLYPVYSESVSGLSRTEFDADAFGAEDTRLALFHGDQGELAGFAYRRFDRIVVGGREHAVVGASVYFRLGYSAGAKSTLFALTESLKFKVRHPLTPLAYLTRSASPAVYRLLATTLPRVYPHPAFRTPETVEEAFRIAHACRGYVTVDQNPWVVKSIAVPTHPERLRRLKDDPLVRFYLQQNPSFAEGTALLVWMPLDLANVLQALAGWVYRRVMPRAA